MRMSIHQDHLLFVCLVQQVIFCFLGFYLLSACVYAFVLNNDADEWNKQWKEDSSVCAGCLQLLRLYIVFLQAPSNLILRADFSQFIFYCLISGCCDAWKHHLTLLITVSHSSGGQISSFVWPAVQSRYWDRKQRKDGLVIWQQIRVTVDETQMLIYLWKMF